MHDAECQMGTKLWMQKFGPNWLKALSVETFTST